MGKQGTKKPRARRRTTLRERKQAFSVRREDPLFQIFERRLYEFDYDSREAFIEGVVAEYIEQLAAEESSLVLSAQKDTVKSAVADEVSDMLVRRIYGCLEVISQPGSRPANTKDPLKKLEADLDAEDLLENAASSPIGSETLKQRLLKLAAK